MTNIFNLNAIFVSDAKNLVFQTPLLALFCCYHKKTSTFALAFVLVRIMNYSISIVFATLFFVLSAAMFVVMIPQKKEYEHYKKSRFSLGTAFFLLGLIGLLENDFLHPTLDDYIKFSFMSMICLTFTALNYLSFFYISETAQVRLKTVIKSVLLGGGTYHPVFFDRI